MSEASARQAARADRLLLDGCVKIVCRSNVSVRARVQSTTRRERYYDCGWTMGVGWWCRCPSRSVLCSHLLAVRWVSATPRPARDPLAFVTTLTWLPSHAELQPGGAAPERAAPERTPQYYSAPERAAPERTPQYYSARATFDPRPVSPPLSATPETIGLGPAVDGR